MTNKLILVSLIAFTGVAPAYGATPAAYAALDRRTNRACVEASALRNATAGPVTRFSDRVGMDARMVTGTFPQARLNGKRATMLCLYNRATRRAETQEMVEPIQSGDNLPITDIWWRGTEMNGQSVGNSPVTLMMGSDGKIGGRSACNSYSVNYTLSGTALRIFPGMIGTRMACPPLRMDQESQFRAILASASMASIETDGALMLRGPSGQSLRFVRETGRRKRD